MDGPFVECFPIVNHFRPRPSLLFRWRTHAYLQHLEELPELEHVEGEDLLAQLRHLGGRLGRRCYVYVYGLYL